MSLWIYSYPNLWNNNIRVLASKNRQSFLVLVLISFKFLLSWYENQKISYYLNQLIKNSKYLSFDNVFILTVWLWWKSTKFPNKLACSTFFGIGVLNETDVMVPETRTLLSIFTLENVCSSKAYLYSFSPEYNRTTHRALKSGKKLKGWKLSDITFLNSNYHNFIFIIIYNWKIEQF